MRDDKVCRCGRALVMTMGQFAHAKAAAVLMSVCEGSFMPADKCTLKPLSPDEKARVLRQIRIAKEERDGV